MVASHGVDMTDRSELGKRKHREVEKVVQRQMGAALEQARNAAASTGGGALSPHLPANASVQQFSSYMDAIATSTAGQHIMALALETLSHEMF